MTSLGENTESSPEFLVLQTRKHVFFFICPSYIAESSKLRRACSIPGETCEADIPF